MFKSMLTITSLIVACPFAYAGDAPTICKGRYAIHYPAAHMENIRYAAQTVGEMSVKLSDDGSLIVAVRLKGDKEATQYSRKFTCNSNLMCTNEDFQKIQLTRAYNKLLVKNLGQITLYDQKGGAYTTLLDKAGGDDVFELNQLTNVSDCT